MKRGKLDAINSESICKASGHNSSDVTTLSTTRHIGTLCLENPQYSFDAIVRVQEQSLKQRRHAIDCSLALIERIKWLTEKDQLNELNSELLMLLMNSMRVVEEAQKELLQKYVSTDIIEKVFPEDISKQTYLDEQIYNLLLLVHRATVNYLKPDHPSIQQQLKDIIANTQFKLSDSQ